MGRPVTINSIPSRVHVRVDGRVLYANSTWMSVPHRHVSMAVSVTMRLAASPVAVPLVSLDTTALLPVTIVPRSLARMVPLARILPAALRAHARLGSLEAPVAIWDQVAVVALAGTAVAVLSAARTL